METLEEQNAYLLSVVTWIASVMVASSILPLQTGMEPHLLLFD
jgi:hypothetical protein